MNTTDKKQNVIKWLRSSYWAGAIMDAVAFLQMAFPRYSAKLMKVSIQPGVDNVFAMRLGASVMLAWTVLLIWGDRKPLERADILPITLIIVGLNFLTMIGAVIDGLLLLGTIIPQIILCFLLFMLYAYSYWKAKRINFGG